MTFIYLNGHFILYKSIYLHALIFCLYFSLTLNYRIPVYKKTAEVCLQMDSVYSNAGQICKFEWHNDNK